MANLPFNMIQRQRKVKVAIANHHALFEVALRPAGGPRSYAPVTRACSLLFERYSVALILCTSRLLSFQGPFKAPVSRTSLGDSLRCGMLAVQGCDTVGRGW